MEEYLVGKQCVIIEFQKIRFLAGVVIQEYYRFVRQRPPLRAGIGGKLGRKLAPGKQAQEAAGLPPQQPQGVAKLARGNEILGKEGRDADVILPLRRQKEGIVLKAVQAAIGAVLRVYPTGTVQAAVDAGSSAGGRYGQREALDEVGAVVVGEKLLGVGRGFYRVILATQQDSVARSLVGQDVPDAHQRRLNGVDVAPHGVEALIAGEEHAVVVMGQRGLERFERYWLVDIEVKTCFRRIQAANHAANLGRVLMSQNNIIKVHRTKRTQGRIGAKGTVGAADGCWRRGGRIFAKRYRCALVLAAGRRPIGKAGGRGNRRCRSSNPGFISMYGQ